MRANKIGIVLSKTPVGKYNVQVVGLNDEGRIIASVSELEEQSIGFATVSRVVDRLWAVIKLRLNRGELELVVAEKDKPNEVGRIGSDVLGRSSSSE